MDSEIQTGQHEVEKVEPETHETSEMTDLETIADMRWRSLTSDECHRAVSIMYHLRVKRWPKNWPSTSAFNKIWRRVEGKKLARKSQGLRNKGLYECLAFAVEGL